jgi:hypothetical protein
MGGIMYKFIKAISLLTTLLLILSITACTPGNQEAILANEKLTEAKLENEKLKQVISDMRLYVEIANEIKKLEDFTDKINNVDNFMFNLAANVEAVDRDQSITNTFFDAAKFQIDSLKEEKEIIYNETQSFIDTQEKDYIESDIDVSFLNNIIDKQNEAISGFQCAYESLYSYYYENSNGSFTLYMSMRASSKEVAQVAEEMCKTEYERCMKLLKKQLAR